MSEAINNGGLEEKKEVTTAEHFEWFKNEANYWLKRFGLYGWQVRFLHEDNDNTRDCWACIAYKMSSRLAVITLAVSWDGEEIDVVNVRKSAFHEVCELLLARVQHIAECRWAQPEEFQEAVHGVIRILENVVWEDMKV